MRTGFGYDSHRLVAGRRLILGGVEIPCDKGLAGHSDADALLHAIGDAILGAVGAGDIGRHFPDTDPAYKDISSLELLRRIKVVSDEKGYKVHNVDTTVVLEKPKLAGYIQEMESNIADNLNIPADRVNVKAKTNEGMGFVGRLEGIAVYAVCTVKETGH
ncbi:MAG: 2-C-methyl-D-erythritol 2,4-cyclodiphosphate synthase [Deltaproteobacteria bacterium]|nr:2-C-methyl-D-erythritol 2,4-cyclodiphosphate synthase [Deltaproteobacteria bacterium]